MFFLPAEITAAAPSFSRPGAVRVEPDQPQPDHAALGGDVTKVARCRVRFAGVGFPGEAYVTDYWDEGHQILIQAKSKERDAKIISNAAITLR